MNTVILLGIAILVVLYFMKDSEGESVLVKILRYVKLLPEKPEPAEKQVFDGYIDLAYESLKDDPEKAKELAVKAVEESSKYVVKDDEEIKPKQLTANDWLKSPAVAVAIILGALLLLSQCDLRPIKFSVPDIESVKSLIEGE
jgi:hypothetical protein